MVRTSINKNEAHVWFASLAQFDVEATKSEMLPLLSDSELQRYERLHFDEHKHQLLASRLFIRTILSRYCSKVKKESWHFSSNDYGRPDIDPEKSGVSDLELSFNLSHSAGMAAIALSTQGEVGVDIEECVRSRRVEKISHRYFSKLEQQDLMSLPEAERQQYFYRLWTLKEAYIKACGMGLAIPLDHFSFAIEKEAIVISFDKSRNDDASSWRFWQSEELDLGGKSPSGSTQSKFYRIAVARKAKDSELVVSNFEYIN